MTLRLVPKPPETTRWLCVCPPCSPQEWHVGTFADAQDHYRNCHQWGNE